MLTASEVVAALDVTPKGARAALSGLTDTFSAGMPFVLPGVGRRWRLRLIGV